MTPTHDALMRCAMAIAAAFALYRVMSDLLNVAGY
jgi:hypothetical protein